MLAHRFWTTLVLLAAGSPALAQVVGHSPGPTTRYEWNTNRPYSGGWSYGGGRGGGFGVGVGVGVPFGGYGYYAPYAGFGGPVIVAPYGVYDGFYGGGYTAFPPSTATFGYSPRPIFTAPWPPQAVPPLLPVTPDEELQMRMNEPRERPLTREERLPVLKPSTPEAQQRSLRHMATADQQFKMGHYAGAALESRRGIEDAEDLPDNYFRLGYALAAQRRYDEAVRQWKLGLMLDPSWPTRGESLTAIFGENNQFEKSTLMHRVADYVRLDPREPDRIFLFGVLMFFDGDRASAKSLFESAIRVVGNEPYLMAFLNASSDAPVGNAGNPPVANPAPLQAPGANADDSRPVPPPPPANVNRSRTVPPAGLNPDGSQPIPQRKPAEAGENEGPAQAPEKFPTLQAPKLPDAASL